MTDGQIVGVALIVSAAALVLLRVLVRQHTAARAWRRHSPTCQSLRKDHQ